MSSTKDRYNKYRIIDVLPVLMYKYNINISMDFCNNFDDKTERRHSKGIERTRFEPHLKVLGKWSRGNDDGLIVCHLRVVLVAEGLFRDYEGSSVTIK